MRRPLEAVWLSAELLRAGFSGRSITEGPRTLRELAAVI